MMAIAGESMTERSLLGPYLRAIRAHRLLVISVLLVAALAAAGWLAVRDEEYEAEAQLLIQPWEAEEPDPTLLSLPLLRAPGADPTRTVQTAAGLLEADTIESRAGEIAGGGLSGSDVENAVEVEPAGETNIIAIVAHQPSPRRAAELADAYTQAVLEIRAEELERAATSLLERVNGQLEALSPGSPARPSLERVAGVLGSLLAQGSDPTVALAQPAALPTEPLGSPAWLVVGLALVAGTVLGTGAALLLELVVPDRIRSEEDLAGAYPLPVLARVPRLPRRHRRERELTDPRIREAFRTLRVQLELRKPGPRAVMITSPSSGDGKTSAAFHLARELAASGKRVVVFDADVRNGRLREAFGLARRSDGIPPEREKNFRRIARSVPESPRIRLVDGRDLHGAEVEEPLRRLHNMVPEALSDADWVVIDTPPIGEVADALTFVDRPLSVIIVSQMGVSRRMSLEVAQDLLSRSDTEPVGYVLIGAPSPESYYHYQPT
jgi:Mrp family chromosome partitioning ATPase/capsular polysaccharide biosynthesis protein